jgi:uncharacterized repeat protein (TIGR03803 family)
MKTPVLKNRRGCSVPTSLLLTFAAIASVIFTAPAQASSVETVLHSFSGSDGKYSAFSLLRDTAGNLYGVTRSGGANSAGTVFELSPQGNAWVTNTLYSFKGGTDGSQPSGRLIMDGAGNLYGVTGLGGVYGLGTAYRLSPGPNGTWIETILWSFNSAGYNPTGGLTFDAAGNLYGAAYVGGRVCANASGHGCGIVFKFSPLAKGKWKYSVIYHFLGQKQNDGQQPNGDLVFDAAGNLYGTTFMGGTPGMGTVFELSPSPSGTWTEKVIHSFPPPTGSSDGYRPPVGLIVDQAGNLYGAAFGGVYSDNCKTFCGTIFEVSPSGNGWTETLIYSFTGSSDGAFPSTVLGLNAGNLYGTTYSGGNKPGMSGAGVVFELSPSGGGWTQAVLHAFTNSPDGAVPSGGVILDGAGNIYGSTQVGGTNGDGTVYQISH